MLTNNNFRSRVEAIMAKVPEGQVTTYGDIAGLAGQANASRIVGGIAHYGNTELPWHRLVNRFGGLAAGYPGGREQQAVHLDAEGVKCAENVVISFKEKRWRPSDL